MLHPRLSEEVEVRGPRKKMVETWYLEGLETLIPILEWLLFYGSW